MSDLDLSMSTKGLDMFIVVLSSSFGLIYEDHETPLIYDYHESESEANPTTLVRSQWFWNLMSKQASAVKAAQAWFDQKC